jgi:hypothetical protein
MGLLRRPTPGEIVEGGRFSRPCGPDALRAQSQKPNMCLRRHYTSNQCPAVHSGFAVLVALWPSRRQQHDDGDEQCLEHHVQLLTSPADDQLSGQLNAQGDLTR